MTSHAIPGPRALPSPWSKDPDDLALLAGMTVDDNDDDDPMLIYPDGQPVETWREDYPYDERLPRHEYEHSPPTSSDSTITAVRPPRTARSATFSPVGPAPMTTTS